MKIPGTLMYQEISEIPRVYQELLKFDWNSLVKRVITSEFQPTSVLIAARGTSDNAAHFLKYLVETKIGLPCGLASPSIATLYQAPMSYSNSLVIAISQSGKSPDLLAFVERARENRARILSFTNDPFSPLALIAHEHVDVRAGSENAIPATKSFAGQIMASYLFTCGWAEVNSDSAEVPEKTSQCLARESEIANFANKLDISRPIYVLGRGISYPHAREFALKIQETCHIPIQNYSTSDFLHGPIAALKEGDQVIFLSPHHLPQDSFGEALSRVREVGATIFWIGGPPDSNSAETVLSGAVGSNEITSSLSDVVLYQNVTRILATRNGFDPDEPKGLSKVTLTR